MEINEINKINPILKPIAVDIEKYNQQKSELIDKELDCQKNPGLRTSKAAMRKAKAECSCQIKTISPSPEINSNICVEKENFVLNKDTAQYKGSDYANAVRVERGISLKEAFEIAQSDANIDYFVYVTGWTMVLEIPDGVQFDPAKDPLNLVTDIDYIFDSGKPGKGYCRVFHQGDVVFFKKEGMWLGSAPGLADTYVKKTSI